MSINYPKSFQTFFGTYLPLGLYVYQGNVYVMDDFGNLIEHSDLAFEQLLAFRHDHY